MREEYGIEIVYYWWNLYVCDGNIKENIYVNCRKLVDFIFVKYISCSSW